MGFASVKRPRRTYFLQHPHVNLSCCPYRTRVSSDSSSSCKRRRTVAMMLRSSGVSMEKSGEGGRVGILDKVFCHKPFTTSVPPKLFRAKDEPPKPTSRRQTAASSYRFTYFCHETTLPSVKGKAANLHKGLQAPLYQPARRRGVCAHRTPRYSETEKLR